MKKLNFYALNVLFCLLFIGISLHAQTKDKPTYYAKDDGIGNVNQISQTEFKTLLEDCCSYYYNGYDIDTMNVFVIIPREHYGKISKNELRNLRTELQNLSNTKIDSTNYIIIDYFPGIFKNNNNCESNYINNSFYPKQNRKFKKIANKNNVSYSYFNILKTKEEGRKTYNWILDKNQFVEKMFFKLFYSCGSLVVIDPEGNYKKYNGEHNIKRAEETFIEISTK